MQSHLSRTARGMTPVTGVALSVLTSLRLSSRMLTACCFLLESFVPFCPGFDYQMPKEIIMVSKKAINFFIVFDLPQTD